MGDLEHNAEYWRAKADEARTVADSVEGDTERAHMLAIAESYDRIARLAENEPPHLLVIVRRATTFH